MHVQEVKRSELENFVQEDSFLKPPLIPVSPHRAQSQFRNPRADDDDVVLIIAYSEKKEILAYAGALPDRISGKQKIAWNSCWYADKEKGGTIALPLFLQFIKRWKGRILMRGLTAHTREIVVRMPYFKVVDLGISTRFFTRFYIENLLIEKLPSLKWVRIFLKIADSILNVYVRGRWWVWGKRHDQQPGIAINLVHKIDDKTARFIETHNTTELIRRGKEELEWIISYPWVITETQQNKILREKYFFSSVAKSFNYYRLQIKHYGELKGFALLKDREHHFEVPYLYFEEDHIKQVTICLLKFMQKKKMRSLNVSNPSLIKVLGDVKLPFIYRKSDKNELYVSNELVDKVGANPILQDGDGDVVFT